MYSLSTLPGEQGEGTEGEEEERTDTIISLAHSSDFPGIGGLGTDSERQRSLGKAADALPGSGSSRQSSCELLPTCFPRQLPLGASSSSPKTEGSFCPPGQQNVIGRFLVSCNLSIQPHPGSSEAQPGSQLHRSVTQPAHCLSAPPPSQTGPCLCLGHALFQGHHPSAQSTLTPGVSFLSFAPCTRPLEPVPRIQHHQVGL